MRESSHCCTRHPVSATRLLPVVQLHAATDGDASRSPKASQKRPAEEGHADGSKRKLHEKSDRPCRPSDPRRVSTCPSRVWSVGIRHLPLSCAMLGTRATTGPGITECSWCLSRDRGRSPPRAPPSWCSVPRRAGPTATTRTRRTGGWGSTGSVGWDRTARPLGAGVSQVEHDQQTVTADITNPG
jgi:hypothetical protein